MSKVIIRDAGVEFDAEDNESVLEAAIRHGFDYPRGCQNGVCGDCKSVLVSGRINQAPVSKMVLSDQERKEGLFLACKSKVQTDCVVVPCLRENLSEQSNINGRISSIDRVGRDVAIVRVKTDQLFSDYHPGQYANVNFGNLPAREYSFANCRGDHHLEFHIRKVAGGRVSTHVHDRASIGDPVSITGPFGFAYLRPKTRGLLVLIASGTGLAPIKSILHAAVQAKYADTVHVYQSAQCEEGHYLVEEIRQLCGQLRDANHFRTSGEAETGATAREQLLALLDANYTVLANATAFLCGSPAIVEACRRALVSKSLPQDRCYADAFVMRTPTTEQVSPPMLSG
ncbi:2Fe-2S iron-sulfur cluster-binding protein [Hyphomicrobium facile]|uniref:CDP-4-dehydro-6-deoxyglucose reductase n=1 Tax=Hyphomicrobium facile TaxID=51670 RepID=A0A1I7NE60_9HYPH|nr:2Fe-2S iron-sulfur cluster-binding protein [Hyphomicrobium facile]SFV32836.1 CDP-4-dehydro-6-deoxyglucose reductase [Hyphomicrobium facile]